MGRESTRTPRIPSPNEFYRAQRPERFSDSVVVDKPTINRTLLEFHLATLTSRSQELAFEGFARGLIERTVCPNLLPHTGPTGGGDSKVDSETYPVADSLALGWYTGIGREASQERWAFAFSATKEWRPKLTSDVAKLVGTNRGYVKAFFVTNQYVSDRERGKIEDRLGKEHGIEVRVFDLSWLLDSVFNKGHETFAIEALGLSPTLSLEIRKGPRDTEREARLAELEDRIQAALREERIDLRLVNDALRSATTARGLERPRTEVDGRFLRASDLATKLGSRSDQLKAVYEWAWTTFFWYEDYSRFAALAKEALDLAAGTENAHHLELLTNLHGCLQSAVGRGWLSAEAVALSDFATTLLKLLDKTGKVEQRPSNALHAQTLAAKVRLTQSPEKADKYLAKLGQIVKKARPLVGYPFEQTADLIAAMGPYFGQQPAYGKLFETVVEIAGKRQGDVTAAQMLLKRGAQQLEAGEHLDALRNIGRALGRLYKHESREELVHALYLAGAAYEDAELLWAARGSLVVAASVATDEFHKYGRITRYQAACYDRLRWLELRLGRIPEALQWHQLSVLASQAAGITTDPESFDFFDAVLGIPLLDADLSQLKELERLPDVLDELGLFMSRGALLYALGHPSELPDELFKGADPAEGEAAFMRQWRDQPAGSQQRDTSLGTTDSVSLESDVLGCHVEVSCQNRSPAIETGESLLAALESLLSTAIDAHLVASEPYLRVTVLVSEFADEPVVFRLDYDLGRPHLHVACQAFDPHSRTHEQQRVIKERLVEILINVLAHIVVGHADMKAIRKLIVDELALQRSVDFTGSFVTLGNVLGPDPKRSVDRWFQPRHKLHALTRGTKWDAEDSRVLPHSPTAIGEGNRATGAKAPMEFRLPRKHTQVRTVSLIRQHLWNKAGWSGIGYFGRFDVVESPMMALLFRDGDAGAQIFQALRQDLGERDEKELLRVSIVRGISRKNPAWYRVVIGTETAAWKGETTPNQDMVVMVSRVHMMEPETTENLDRFLTAYEKAKSFVLAPALVNERKELLAIGKITLAKTALHVRHAWEIGLHDPDSPAIRSDDDVIVPPGKAKPPVKELVKWYKERVRAKRGTQ